MMINRMWCKLLPDLVIFSSGILLDFHESIGVLPIKYLTCFLPNLNAKQFWNISEEKYFDQLRILNLFIKLFANFSVVFFALTFW